jgi:2-dehydro-3-deoxyphosphooctonate aldolase (KDO 8-P synthase)
VKKGQFMAPWDMENVAEKLRTAGNQQVMLTDRGTFFGYNRLVSDFRCLMQMRAYAPVCYDATHSVQEPGGLGAASGGRRDYAGPLALAAAAVGIDALFIETHPSPDDALSDAGCQIALSDMPELLTKLLAVHNAIS